MCLKAEVSFYILNERNILHCTLLLDVVSVSSRAAVTCEEMKYTITKKIAINIICFETILENNL